MGKKQAATIAATQERPKIEEDLMAELMVIAEDLDRFGATFQIVLDEIKLESPVFHSLVEGRALQFLLTSVNHIEDNLAKFIRKYDCEDGASC
jgi:hypothetical protein